MMKTKFTLFVTVKALILLVMGVGLVGGCAFTHTMESVSGEWGEAKNATKGLVLFDNGEGKWVANGRTIRTVSWKLVDDDVHISYGGGDGIRVFRIYPNGTLSAIASLSGDGKQIPLPAYQLPSRIYKKLKQNMSATTGQLTPKEAVKEDGQPKPRPKRKAGIRIGSDGLAYLVADNTLYTGQMISTDEKEGFVRAMNFRKGKLHGILSQKYPDGRKFGEAHYVDGVKHGDSIKWYPNGQKQQHSVYLRGQLQKHQEWEKDGTQKVLAKWNPDGTPKGLEKQKK